MARRVPVLANLFPSGDRLMEDFYYAGGLPALMQVIRTTCLPTPHGQRQDRVGENIASAEVLDPEVIRPLSTGRSASRSAGGTLHGNLAPNGAVIKPSAASPKLLQHSGRALVFDSQPRDAAAMADPELDCDENTVLVLRNAGPVGAPGMPEWGNLPIPRKLLQAGVRDMLRLSDARMSGTHYGTCVLHISPESAVGGPLALVRTGDVITLDVAQRRLQLLVSEEELARRRAAWTAPVQPLQRGFTRLYQAHVTQAHEGCDFDFLQGTQPSPEPAIY
jgi:dihydroxyacid dehydratase/phosphogluconate dehydratase